jgi:hypothetical protein
MSGIETGYPSTHTHQGQLTTDSESVEVLPTLPSHLALQEHSIMPTEFAALPSMT